MGKIIALGDTHGYSTWEKVVEKEKDADEFVFIGDYFDTFASFSTAEQIYNLQSILNFKKESGKKVVLLLGNHDHHYFPEVGYTGTSGYQSGGAKSIEAFFNSNRDEFQMAYVIDNVLFTHAGVGTTWFTNNLYGKEEVPFSAKDIADHVNEVWRFKPLAFGFTPNRRSDHYGDSTSQTPIWIRPQALQEDTEIMRRVGIIQVVGHTPVKHINHPGEGSPGYFIDCLAHGEYLIYEDGKFEIGKLDAG